MHKQYIRAYYHCQEIKKKRHKFCSLLPKSDRYLFIIPRFLDETRINSFVWLESDCAGTEEIVGELHIPRDNFPRRSYCEDPLLKTKHNEVLTCWNKDPGSEKFPWGMWRLCLRLRTVPRQLIFSHSNIFFLILKIVQTKSQD